MVWDEHINQQDLEFILPLLYLMEDIITLMSWVVYIIIITMLLLVISRDGGTGKAPRHVPYLKSEA